MNTLLLPEAGRRRRRYSSEFKAEIITACMQPGVSTTAIALANQINPNLVRRWVRQRQLSATEPSTVPALIPVCVSDLVALPSKLDDSDQVNPIKPEPKRSIQSSPPPPSKLGAHRTHPLRGTAWRSQTKRRLAGLTGRSLCPVVAGPIAMILPEQVFLIVEPLDMRWGAERLSCHVQLLVGRSPCDGTAYAFTNRDRSRLKLLVWDGTGVWLCHRRLHSGRFRWPAPGDTVHRLSQAEWQWLVTGVDWQRLSARPPAHWNV